MDSGEEKVGRLKGATGVVGAQAGHMAGKGAMYQSVDMLAQPGGDYSAFKADRSFIPKMSSPPPLFLFC